MISRSEWMSKNDSPGGVRRGIISMDVAMKYEAYITYLNFLEEMKDIPLDGKLRSKNRRALLMTSQKLGVNESTAWKYLSFFDYVSPTPEELQIYKTRTHWNFIK